MAPKRPAAELDDEDGAVLAAGADAPADDAPADDAPADDDDGSGSAGSAGSDSEDSGAASGAAPKTKKPRRPRPPEKPPEPQVPAARPAVSRCADGTASLPLAPGDPESGLPSERERFLYALLHWMDGQTRPNGKDPLYANDTRKNIAASIPRILDALEGDLGRLPDFPLLGEDRGKDGKLLPIGARPVGRQCKNVRALWKALPESKQPVIYGTWAAALEAGVKDTKPDDRSEYWRMNNEVLRSGFCGFDSHDKLAQAVKVMYQFCYQYLVTLSFEGKGWAELTRHDAFAKLLLKKTVTTEEVPKKKQKPAAAAASAGA